MTQPMPRTPAVTSRLPQVGTTIFTVMSALAQQCAAVNLGQGFPDFDGDARLKDAVKAAMDAGHNQYPPMAGVPALREAIAAKIETLYGQHYDPGLEITVPAGGPTGVAAAAPVAAVVERRVEVLAARRKRSREEERRHTKQKLNATHTHPAPT